MSIKVNGIKELQAKLQTLKTNLDDEKMQSTMHTIGNMILNELHQSFEEEKSPFGKRWAPLSSNTAFAYAGGKTKAYTKNGKSQRKSFLAKFGTHGSKKLLHKDGNLSLNWSVNSNNDGVTVSNNSSNDGFAYGLTHQFGSKNGWGRGINIPARPFLPLDDKGELKQGLNDDIIKYLEDKINLNS